MRAGVVTSFDAPPTCEDIPIPVPRTADELLIDVVAAGLHPRVRSQADGSHYTSHGYLPLVPGIDGVGRDGEGVLRYFLLPDTAMGSMAQKTVIDVRRSVTLDDGADPVLVAAVMNPVMSSWIALRRRTTIRPGQNVLVLGATGNAGRMAVQVARHLGAGRIVGVGRRADRLAELTSLGADATVSLVGDADGVARRIGDAARDVDVVIDYLWGRPAADAMAAIITDRADRGRPLTWIEVGSVAGRTAPIPSAALRAARLQIIGSGQGSVATGDIVAELPHIVRAISTGAFVVDARRVALRDITQAWLDTASAERIVIAP